MNLLLEDCKNILIDFKNKFPRGLPAERLYNIIEMRSYGMSRPKIAKYFGVTQERIRQIELLALKIIKKSIRKEIII